MPLEEGAATLRVTEIRRRPRGRVRVATSDGQALTVSAEAVEQAGLRAGDPFDEERRERLDHEEQRCRAHEAALRLLAHRPRSERELGQRLRLRGLPPELIAEEIERLRQAGLLDDGEVARAWVGERQARSPRARRLVRRELLARGVGAGLAEEAVSAIDDRTAALAVARGRAPRLADLDRERFRQRLAGFLQRRGFGWEEIEEAVRTVWAEIEGASAGRSGR